MFMALLDYIGLWIILSKQNSTSDLMAHKLSNLLPNTESHLKLSYPWEEKMVLIWGLASMKNMFLYLVYHLADIHYCNIIIKLLQLYIMGSLLFSIYREHYDSNPYSWKLQDRNLPLLRRTGGHTWCFWWSSKSTKKALLCFIDEKKKSLGRFKVTRRCESKDSVQSLCCRPPHRPTSRVPTYSEGKCWKNVRKA